MGLAAEEQTREEELEAYNDISRLKEPHAIMAHYDMYMQTTLSHTDQPSRFTRDYPGKVRFLPVYPGLSREGQVSPSLPGIIPGKSGFSRSTLDYPGKVRFLPVYPGLSRESQASPGVLGIWSKLPESSRLFWIPVFIRSPGIRRFLRMRSRRESWDSAIFVLREKIVRICGLFDLVHMIHARLGRT